MHPLFTLSSSSWRVSVVALTLAIPLAIAWTKSPSRLVRWLIPIQLTFFCVPLYIQAAGWSAGFGALGWWRWTVSMQPGARAESSSGHLDPWCWLFASRYLLAGDRHAPRPKRKRVAGSARWWAPRTSSLGLVAGTMAMVDRKHELRRRDRE